MEPALFVDADHGRLEGEGENLERPRVGEHPRDSAAHDFGPAATVLGEDRDVRVVGDAVDGQEHDEAHQHGPGVGRQPVDVLSEHYARLCVICHLVRDLGVQRDRFDQFAVGCPFEPYFLHATFNFAPLTLSKARSSSPPSCQPRKSSR